MQRFRCHVIHSHHGSVLMAKFARHWMTSEGRGREEEESLRIIDQYERDGVHHFTSQRSEMTHRMQFFTSCEPGADRPRRHCKLHDHRRVAKPFPANHFKTSHSTFHPTSEHVYEQISIWSSKVGHGRGVLPDWSSSLHQSPFFFSGLLRWKHPRRE